MIGQKKLIDTVTDMLEDNKLPRFILLIGEKGSGRRTFTKEIITRGLRATFLEFDGKVESVRKMISESYKLSSTVVYFIGDGDDMSLQAKNALLKVTEEPPNNAYFVISLVSENNALETIRSRATILRMNPYSEDDLMRFYGKDEVEEVSWCCETPREIELIQQYGVDEFFDFVNKTVDNIDTVTGVNALKLGSYMQFEEGDGKYDLKLFLKAFRNTSMSNYYHKKDPKYLEWMLITSKTVKMLDISGINKSGVFDMWIFDIRKASNANG